MFNLFDHEIKQMMVESDTPGIAIGIIDHQKIMTQGYGVTSIETGEPIRDHTLFQIASCTKPITATLIMKLVEEGYFTLDQPIGDLVTTLSETPLAPLTLKMLLSHHGGLPDGGDHRKDRSLRELIENELIKINPVMPGIMPGYSNHHYNLAGYVAQEVVGKPFTELLHNYILDPLDMTHTTADPKIVSTHSWARNHYRDNQDQLSVFHDQLYNHSNIPSFGLYSNMTDMLQFLALHLNQNQILEQSSFKLMGIPPFTPLQYRSAAYGLGFGVSADFGRQRLGHMGRMMGYHSMITLFPEYGFGVVLLANGGNFNLGELMERIIDHFLKEYQEEVVPVFQQGQAGNDDISGEYLGNDTGPLKIVRNGNRYNLHTPEEQFLLKFCGDHRYAAIRDDGEIETVIQYIPEEIPLIIFYDGAAQRESEPFITHVKQPEIYEGIYNHQNSSQFRIMLDGDQLIIIEDGYDTPLIVVRESLFYQDNYGLIQFIRGDSGEITGLLEGSGWFYRRLFE